ncbi:MAG: alpha/beta fold hydrolase [Chloroflexi bacterium]|nr:alpha/beta fold hydrolase [Chloroflexota bacterium]
MKIKVRDITMFYEDHGQGIPVLFVHGYPLNQKIWQPQIEGLSDIVRIITPDLRGHGESQASEREYSMDLFAEDCAALLDAIPITQKIVLCGLSMGGYVSFAFLRKYSSRLAGLILTATRASPDSETVKQNREKAITQVQSEGVNKVIDNMLPKLLSPLSMAHNPALVNQVREIMQSVSSQGYIGDLTGMKNRPDSTPLLPTINIPTLLIFGDQDEIISIDEAKRLDSLIPDSRLEIINGAGHLLNLEKPEEFNTIVRDFLTKKII